MKICDGRNPSPYEQEEILFLETVAGLVRKDPFLMNIFLPSHQHSAKVSVSLKGTRTKKLPTKNPLFDCTRIDANIRRVEILPDGNNESEKSNTANSTVDKLDTVNAEDESDSTNVKDNLRERYCDSRSISSSSKSDANMEGSSEMKKEVKCDCEETDRFNLLDAILTYFESPVSNIYCNCLPPSYSYKAFM